MGIVRDWIHSEDRLPFAPPGFNWGAFLFTYLWGLGNGAFRKTLPILMCELLLFVPGLNIVFFFIWIALRIKAGLDGNLWAYEGRAWYDVKDFKDTQSRYLLAAAIMHAVFLCLWSMFVFSSMF